MTVSSPSKLANAGRTAVIMLRAGWWPDAIDRLDEFLEITYALSAGEQEVDEAVDALREAALALRDDAEKPERRENVTAQRIEELAALAEGVAESARRGALSQAGRHPPG